MKALTIPKLELQVALLAARLGKEVQLALTLQIERTFILSNSTAIVQWLHSLQKQPVFVADRVAKKLELKTADEWYQVESADNCVLWFAALTEEQRKQDQHWCHCGPGRS